MDPARAITIIENTPIDYVDFASPESGLGPSFVLTAVKSGLGAVAWSPALSNLVYFALLGVMGFSPDRRWAGLAMAASLLLILGSAAVIGY